MTLSLEKKSNSNAKKLFSLYKTQPILHQKILQLKAMLYYIETKGQFLAALSYSNLHHTNHKKFTSATVNPILNSLKENNLLEKDFNCHSTILHPVLADAISNDKAFVSETLKNLTRFFSPKINPFSFEGSLPNLRLAHIAAHMNDEDFFINEENNSAEGFNTFVYTHLFRSFYAHDLDPEWIKTRTPVIQLYLLCVKLSSFNSHLSFFAPDAQQWVRFIREHDCVLLAIQHRLDKHSFLMSQIIQLSFSFNTLSYIEQCLPILPQQYYTYEAQGMLAFFKGNKPDALKCYAKAMQLFKHNSRKNEWFNRNIHGILYILSLLMQTPSAEDLKKATGIIDGLKKITTRNALIYVLNAFLDLKRNDSTAAISNYNYAQSILKQDSIVYPFLHALNHWVATLLSPEKTPNWLKIHEDAFQFSYTQGHTLTAQLQAELILRLDENNKPARYFINELHPFDGFCFMNIAEVREKWEYAIAQLQTLLTNTPSMQGDTESFSTKRMAWLVYPSSFEIEVVEQVLRKTGIWSSGRPIALKRLIMPDAKLDYLSAHDKRALMGLKQEFYGWYNEEAYFWDTKITWNALIGHPLVFHAENRDIPLELVKGVVSLNAETIENGYYFKLSHYSDTPRIFLEKESPNRYRVIDFSDEDVSTCKILSEKGLSVPFKAKEAIINILCNSKSNIQIHSDIADEALPVVPSDATLHVHLFPLEEGIKLNLWTRPFGTEGPYCRASHGQRSIIASVNTENGEQRQKVLRNFEEEQQNLRSLITYSGLLSEFDEKTDEWHFESVEQSLELLLELEDYKKTAPLILEWPKGQTLKVNKRVSSKNLSLSIKGSQYWFEYEGEVQIDEQHALDIKRLLQLLDQSQGRFVRLDNGEFIALTDKFKRQLEELRALSDGNKVYHLSTSGLRGLAEEAGTLQEDAAWQGHLQKITAMEKHTPVIPSTLQAELRDYQVEGFSYLSRLAHWEIGACLADDMGLGKTIQAIALLLSHAPAGPCLVIAPTSVCFVWLEELAKFAPTLMPQTLYNASDRKALIDSLGKMDILICSYGLLHQAGEFLVAKAWKMVILDEAQAIKNPETKRWKYAIQLNSPCRIALTGTPIENHLGELWSIFRFLNPGLLGSLSNFQQRFSGPIERLQDPAAKRALKSAVSPYILRRTKSEVLLELPPKIEQAILIEPSKEEIAFYEAVRMKALERIQQLDETESQKKRFSILVEIGRLRQACCHASLVDEHMNIESSKIKMFLMLLKNIIDNKHKALVFSQYVRYLDKIKAILNEEQIEYQYLDGSTSMKKRQAAVEAFQSGKGDAFLISLKAGGTGLNLTAADYVIILDPWWNPAVEDQAADRAHRMGQLRPVTVYRLIMKNSIEEKILGLHKSKKDLAADLLSGADVSGKISEEELVGLIRS